MHGKKFCRIAKDMIGDMLVYGNDICQDCPLENTVSVVAESNDYNSGFSAAQRFGVPVLSGAAVITVKKLMFPER